VVLVVDTIRKTVVDMVIEKESAVLACLIVVEVDNSFWDPVHMVAAGKAVLLVALAPPW
jgi:hypothetical protein